ncbi:hypothetical protein [Streptomyces celluloflavus]|uniref:hypothetical protein n=1 Tax=Streptomyces celluloflavus TaxID=58344 RepID=UPI00368DBD7C
MGKSTVAGDVITMAEDRGWPVLPFRMDEVEADDRTAKAVGRRLGLPSSPATLIARVADGAPALLVVDQLDAASSYSGRIPDVFEAVDDMLEALTASPNIKVVLIARTVDVEKDPRLTSLAGQEGTVERFPLGLLDAEAVRTVLEAGGTSPQLEWCTDHHPARVTELVEPYWDADGPWRQRLLDWVCKWPSAFSADLIRRLIDRGDFDDGHAGPSGVGAGFWHVFEQLAEKEGASAICLLGAFLTRGFQRAVAAGHSDPFDSGHLPMTVGSPAGTLVSETAAAAPGETLDHILPFVIAVAEASHAAHAERGTPSPRWSWPPSPFNPDLDEVPVDVHDARTTQTLLTRALLHDTKRFAAELIRALEGPEGAARHAGAAWSVLAMQGRLIPCLPPEPDGLTPAARQGAAEMAATDPAHGAQLLRGMFRDGDAAVRRAAARSIRAVASMPPGVANDLIVSFLETVLRLYRQGDLATRAQCLDIIDDLYRVDARGLNAALSGER